MLPGQLVALSNTHTQGLQYISCGYTYVRITFAAKMVDTQYGHRVRYVFWHTCNLCNNLVYSLYTYALGLTIDQATFCRMMKIGF